MASGIVTCGEIVERLGSAANDLPVYWTWEGEAEDPRALAGLACADLSALATVGDLRDLCDGGKYKPLVVLSNDGCISRIISEIAISAEEVRIFVALHDEDRILD